ncbi:MAG: S26 family signal peptidase [Thermoguttaceae bacterium]
MQCSNCQFENMPGVRACGRCGASLQLASLALDVHPPRASPGAKRWRQRFPIRRYWARFCAAAASVLPAGRVIDWPFDMPAPSLLLRMIVPGWAQRYAGRPIRGRWIFWCYVGFLLSGLLFAGTTLSWSLLGLAISLHAASVLDVVAATVSDFRDRLVYTVVTLVLLTAVVYYPAGWLLSQVASPQRLATSAPPFEEGDVVLVSLSAYRWSAPKLGDVVFYDLSQQDVQVPGGGHIIYRAGGGRIDRVIAHAGQRVTSAQGKLLVDGGPSPWLPLNPQRVPDGLSIAVPENCYAIFPTVDALAYPLAIWPTVSIVRREQIWGHVYFRYQPLWRFGAIR